MKYLAHWSSLIVLGCLAVPASAEENFELPQLSPKAKVEQRVGITDFSVEYSSPAVKGRKIWGGVVPMDKSWRAGANASTKLTATRDFKFGTTAVKAGSYIIFMIPGEKQWTAALNGDLEAGQNHDPKKDVATMKITPIALAPARERLAYIFSDTTDAGTALDLEWDAVRIRMPIAVDTMGHVNAAIDKTLAETWRPHFMSANYLFQAGDVKRATAFVVKSIQIKSTMRNEWLHAQILWKTGKKADAKAAAARAMKLGPGDPGFEVFWKGEMTKTVATWK
jgi:hypothetical protein